MQFIEGGVCAPLGFSASGMKCGIKPNNPKNDTALIYSEKICSAAGVFTQNRVKAECVKLSKKNLSNGKAQAIIANSGNANACTGEQGFQNALRESAAVSQELKIAPEDVLVCSTGVIGQQLPVQVIEKNVKKLVSALSKKGNKDARTAIMTTDTHFKECAVELEIGGKKVHLGAMCKGSGMIHINLGTMLCFITSDCSISSEMLEKSLKKVVEKTFNCVSVDGDTSTNDSLMILANGMAENPQITSEGKDFDAFYEGLFEISKQMAKKIAGDGEGATKLIECNVKGAKDDLTARALAKSVISSSLVKAAFFGKDANWGRILCAMGYSGEEFDPDKTTVCFESVEGAKRPGSTDFVGEQIGKKNSIMVFNHGVPLNFDEDFAKKVLSEDEVAINITCEDGNGKGTAWGCDLTYDYVKINGDYRT